MAGSSDHAERTSTTCGSASAVLGGGVNLLSPHARVHRSRPGTVCPVWMLEPLYSRFFEASKEDAKGAAALTCG
eukprot:COSAG04_NODE_1265_length_7488_cov_2.080525_4_plen_74_part_00